MNKNIKCGSCGFTNESCIEVGGIGMCRMCGNEMYILNKTLKSKKKIGKYR